VSLDWVAAFFAIAGSVCIAHKIKFGFLLYIVSNISWIVWGINFGVWSLPFLDGVFLCVNIYAYSKWSRGKIE
jgi:hypothetical protein